MNPGGRRGLLGLGGLAALWMGPLTHAAADRSIPPGIALPLYALDGACKDRRFPMLAGGWAVGCAHKGMVDTAIHLDSGRRWTIEPPLDPRHTGASASPSAGAALLMEVGARTRLVELTPSGPVDRPEATRLATTPVAPPAVTPTHFAATLPDRVEALAHHTRTRPTFAADPVGWYPPALAWPFVAWVERSDDHIEQIWSVRVDPPGPVRQVSSTAGHHRHVTSDGARMVWVHDAGLTIWDPHLDTFEDLPADTGFLSAPTISDGVVCWEERGSADVQNLRMGIDILCSDGLNASGPGDQLHPSRSGNRLLYRDAGHTWLVTGP